MTVFLRSVLLVDAWLAGALSSHRRTVTGPMVYPANAFRFRLRLDLGTAWFKSDKAVKKKKKEISGPVIAFLYFLLFIHFFTLLHFSLKTKTGKRSGKARLFLMTKGALRA